MGMVENRPRPKPLAGRIDGSRVFWRSGDIIEIGVPIDWADAVSGPLLAGQSLADDSADGHELLLKVGWHGRRPNLRSGQVGITGISAADEIAGGDGIELVRIETVSIDQVFIVGGVKGDANGDEPAVFVVSDA